MNPAPFHDPARFPFVAELERHWQEIYAEFLAVQDALGDYVEAQLYDHGWQVFGLWNLPHREPLTEGVLRCPRTAALVEHLLPGHGAVAFSVLQPGARIKPHQGKAGPYLRCHLALEVPPGDCAIRVAAETRGWQEGRALVLDDRLEHEAWNLAAARRVVLLLDFIA
ncbi:aspartyl/asparaginyl beta-hydroxylase domain-containing protein [Massilia eburnea]|uniref:aspartyl/asparaginyl beta-hydroxylase domain-containing protein n=1 Tax=Massilia eburnea TaxID=1776165 RepID=UPI0014795553